MGFLRPKMPPPPPPPSSSTAADYYAARPSGKAVNSRRSNAEKAKDQKKVNPKTAIATSPVGVLDDTPLEYKSLLGGGTARKTKKPGA